MPLVFVKKKHLSLLPPYLFLPQPLALTLLPPLAKNQRGLSAPTTLWKRAFALPFILRANFQNISACKRVAWHGTERGAHGGPRSSADAHIPHFSPPPQLVFQVKACL